MSARRKATFYIDASVHKALRMRAAEVDKSPSDLLNTVLMNQFQEMLEDLEDLEVIRKRRKEKGKGISLEKMRKKLKLNE